MIIFPINGTPVAEWDRTIITEVDLKKIIPGGLKEVLRVVHSSKDGTYQLEDRHTYEVPVVQGTYFTTPNF